MLPATRATLESLLQARQLDRTLTSSLPLDNFNNSSGAAAEYAFAPSGVTALDAQLGGGFPRGQLSELVGPRSSGRTSLLLHMLAAATARGELVALIDALDMLDVQSAQTAGIDLSQMLWIRGHVVSNPGMCRDLNHRAVEQAIRALTLVLQAGNFGLVVFDAAEAPAEAIRRLPFTTWLRLQRLIEGSQTTAVLVGTEPMARSSAGLTIKLEKAPNSSPRSSDQLQLPSFGRLPVVTSFQTQIVRARPSYKRFERAGVLAGGARVAFTTIAADCA
jgi:recombination protein RecA